MDTLYLGGHHNTSANLCYVPKVRYLSICKKDLGLKETGAGGVEKTDSELSNGT